MPIVALGGADVVGLGKFGQVNPVWANGFIATHFGWHTHMSKAWRDDCEWLAFFH